MNAKHFFSLSLLFLFPFSHSHAIKGHHITRHRITAVKNSDDITFSSQFKEAEPVHFPFVGLETLSNATSATTPAPSNSGKEDFTDNEKRIIKIATNGLFEGTDKITIDLSELSRKEWCYPLRNGRVISPYGGKRRHSGLDIKTHAGDTVYASFTGRVRFAKPYFGYGNVIVLRHANGMETVYAHNQRNFVRIGDIVKAGQPIAIVGRTGRATTEHVHFEVRINGKAFNPTQFFDTSTCCLRSEKVVAYKSGRIETINVIPSYNLAEDKSEKVRSNKGRG